MQAKGPACVGHSIVELMMLYWYQKTGKWVRFSSRFLDILAKRFDGQPRRWNHPLARIQASDDLRVRDRGNPTE